MDNLDADKPDLSRGLPVAAYAARLGVSQDAVRKRISRGTLAAAETPDGRIIVYPDLDVTDAAMSARRRGPARIGRDLSAMSDHVADLRQERDRLTAQLAASEAERRELAALLAAERERADTVAWTLAEAKRLAAMAGRTLPAPADTAGPAEDRPARGLWARLTGR